MDTKEDDKQRVTVNLDIRQKKKLEEISDFLGITPHSYLLSLIGRSLAEDERIYLKGN